MPTFVRGSNTIDHIYYKATIPLTLAEFLDPFDDLAVPSDHLLLRCYISDVTDPTSTSVTPLPVF